MSKDEIVLSKEEVQKAIDSQDLKKLRLLALAAEQKRHNLLFKILFGFKRVLSQRDDPEARFYKKTLENIIGND